MENFKTRTISLPACDINRLMECNNRSELIRDAVKLFIEKEKTRKANYTPVKENIITFGIEPDDLDFLVDLCNDVSGNARRFYSVSECIRVALRDYFFYLDEKSKEQPKKELDYLERNGIKVIKVLNGKD